MDKYAIIKIGSGQYKVREGENLAVQRQGDKVSADVLLYSDGKDVILGTPTVKDARVQLKVVEQKRGDKIVVSRFKSKSRYRKSKGYRDELTVLHVEKIEFGEKNQEPTKEPKEEKKAPAAKKSPVKAKEPKKIVKKVKKGSK